ncbi:hypothetical protein B0H19DRAFT_1260887 [Mycena capillaripes]|nr:hypothetical protein B0H19DRAFT_1260887 [Mycena capillaripes]
MADSVSSLQRLPRPSARQLPIGESMVTVPLPQSGSITLCPEAPAAAPQKPSSLTSVDIFPACRPTHHHYSLGPRTLPAGHSYTSASPSNVLPADYQHPTDLKAFIEDCQSKGYDGESETTATVRPTETGALSAGKVEQAVRESWARSGLRISPFRLQGLGRLE